MTARAIAEHGRVGLSTPWARQYLPAGPERDQVESFVPAGHTLGVSAAKRPGEWRIWLLDEARIQIWHCDAYDRDLRRACLSALRRHGVPVPPLSELDALIAVPA